MPNTLDHVLKELDVKCEILSELKISLKIKNDSNCKQDEFQFISETIAFDLIAHEEGSNWGTYYGPLSIVPSENGSVIEYPRRTDIDSEKIDYWLSRVKVTQNPIMKSRYADLVWEFSETVGKKKDFKMAQAVIDNNITIVKERLYNDEFSALSKLERGLYLALILKDKIRIKMIKELILEFEDTIAEDQQPGTWGFSFDLLLENKNIDLTAAERSKIITDLESRIVGLRSKNDPDPWAIEAAAIRLANHYNKIGQHDDVSRILNTLREEYKQYSITASPGQVQGWLEKLHELFKHFQLKSEEEEIIKQIQENNIKVNDSLHKFSQSFKISDEQIVNYVNSFLSDDVYLDLGKLSFNFVPKEEQIKEQIYNSSNIAPLSFLLTKTLIDEHGRKSEIGSLEDDLDGHIIQQISLTLDIQSFFLDKVIKKIIEHHKLNTEKLTELLIESPVFLEERNELLKKSIQMYFNEDYISFCHIVVPQIEFAFRTLLSLNGGSILKPKKKQKHNIFQFKVLGDLLSDPIIENIFNTDYKRYFQVLLNNHRGLNLRNDICHGVIKSDAFDKNKANLLFHVLITLSLLRIDESEMDK